MVVCLSFYVSVNADTYPELRVPHWYEKVSQFSKEELLERFGPLEEVSRQTKLLVKESKTSFGSFLENFLLACINSSEEEVANHSKTYLSQLDEVKSELTKENLDEYNESKAQAINREVNEEAKQLLSELLGE